MQNEIPAGTKVKVAVIEKGVTTLRAAEVLAHMDGLVHVDMDGQAVSVDPSQIVPLDAPESAPPAPAADSGNAQIVAELITALTARMEIAEARAKLQEIRFESLEARVRGLEERNPSKFQPQPLSADVAPAPEEQESHLTTDSTAVAATGEAVAGS